MDGGNHDCSWISMRWMRRTENLSLMCSINRANLLVYLRESIAHTIPAKRRFDVKLMKHSNRSDAARFNWKLRVDARPATTTNNKMIKSPRGTRDLLPP